MNCRTRRTYTVKIGYILQKDRVCAVERQDIYCRKTGYVLYNGRIYTAEE
jgi:hypothetical protein